MSAFEPPSATTLATLAAQLGMKLSRTESETYSRFLCALQSGYAALDTAAMDVRETGVLRESWSPSMEENPLGGWFVRTLIGPTGEGSLNGLTVAVKDSISVAGVPMTVGSEAFEGFVPRRDATVVTRILAEGGTLTGKAVCEDMCFSVGSHTSITGPVLNPRGTDHVTGGSSSGCAALVASGEVDVAIGGDNGGSVRIPAAWTGIVGLKPTYGLVPCTGAMPVDVTIDHLGPMTRSVAAARLLLLAIAGPDGDDPRQCALGDDWRVALEEPEHNPRAVRVGILREGFDWPGISNPELDRRVQQCAQALARHGHALTHASVPLHRVAAAAHTAILAESSVLRGSGVGTGWKGDYDQAFMRQMVTALRTNVDLLPAVMKAFILFSRYLESNVPGEYYGKAQNLARRLRDQYDDALTHADVLLMPTVPDVAPRLPKPDASLWEEMKCGFGANVNAAAANLTGHPALTIPCGTIRGLPFGLMLVGRPLSDALLLRLALELEDDIAA